MISRLPLVALLCAATLVALAGCAGAAARAETAPVGPIVFIGDSIMAGNGLDDGEDWPSLLAAEDGLDIVNLACSGAGFVAVGSCGSAYAGLAASAEKVHPSVIVVESSSNDIGSSDAAIAAATETTIASLRKAMPRARIVGLSTIWNDHSDLPAEIGYSSDVLEVAMEAHRGTYLDVGQPLQGHPEWMQSDDVHPTLLGQEAILQAMRTALLGAKVPV